ncbi:sialic acid-binding Ig-like lectin 10 [Mugil cephalus]|uniref:sialic acid-binding Ig-like lectin 10 n=1 Tax=Mugil cephalus TaxID=48193 RepID=UPI001FB72D17|nr:sialic acid-binding Ig-like lectin 10 [Mugil cephalus]
MMSEQKVSRDHCDKKREREQDKRVCRVEEETERVKHHLRMFVLFWVTLLFSVRGSSADTDSSTGLKQHCGSAYGYCVSLSEGTITAEAGLCVVIPCSFTTGYAFTPSAIVWYKCDPSKEKCDDSDIIFHSSENDEKAQSGFIGRVSYLEPDVRQRNCSIMINDLNESDSGLYQFRVNGYKYEGTAYERTDGFTYPSRSTVSVKGVSQKPTVMIPPLIEGQQSTLTCTAPGLCSGSVPTITWMWRGAAEDDSLLRGNITGYQTENVTAVTQRHSSTLTFNSSAEHHSSSISCKVSFTGGATTEETVTLNVTYVKKIEITGDRSVKEGETLNVTCSVDSFPPSFITWTKYSEESVQNVTGDNLQNNTDMDTLFISNVTTEDSGQYICTATHLNNTLMEKVNVNVIYQRTLQISGDRTVKEGETLNVTCSVDSFPPSLITWTKLSSNTILHNNTGSASLVISDVTTEDSGQYVCTATHLNTTVTLHADVTVTWLPKIQNDSVCVNQSEVLTCVCISEGFPIPTIEWPLLENHTEYSVITTVSNHTVNSTLTLTVKHHGHTVVECVSSNRNDKVKQNLTIQTNVSKQDIHKIVPSVEVIIAFVIGVLLSAVICCLVQQCHRRKPKNSGKLDETLEMVTSPDDPLIYNGQAVGDDLTHTRGGADNGDVSAEKAAPELNSEPKDVEYANIDFSLLKSRPRESTRKQESTETEYAEIKKEVQEEREDDGGDESEMLEDKEEDEEMMEEDVEVMMVEDEEMKLVPEEQKREEEAVYSNVNDIMREIWGKSKRFSQKKRKSLFCEVNRIRMDVLIWVTLLMSVCGRVAKSGAANSGNISSTSTSVPTQTTTVTEGQRTLTSISNVSTITTQETVSKETVYPRISNSCRCEVQSEALAHVCIIEGFPLLTIKWPLLESHTEYNFSIKASKWVNSTISVSVKDNINTTIECISSYNVLENISQPNDLLSQLLETVKQPPALILFSTGVFIGILLSSAVTCLAVKCNRKKQKRSVDLSQDLEMATTQAVPLMDAVEVVVDNGIYNLAAEAMEGEAESAEQSAPDNDIDPKEVEYSDIDFSLMKRKDPTLTGELQDTETEYAEIKREEIQERLDNARAEGEMLEGSEDSETRIVSAEEEGGEGAALYSNPDEIRTEAEEIM